VNQINAAKQRLFFALWPGDAVRSQLGEVSRQWTRRPIAEEKLHMTLVFLGDRDAEQRQCFCDAAASVKAESFVLQLDYLGAWPRPGIQWLGSSEPCEALLQLVRELNRCFIKCGFEPEKRRFVPHITLSRKERKPRPKNAVAAIEWPVQDFALVESLATPEGVRYQVLQRWLLKKEG